MNYESELLKIARESIVHYLSQKQYKIEKILWPSEYETANGAFVTLYKGKDLRGCIGRHTRLKGNIAEEIAELAIYAAVEDPRFEEVTLEELEHLRLEISLLSKPTPVLNIQELDPKVFGVIVHSGGRSATLLPDIEGVDTVEDQLQITRRKAGISSTAKLEIEKFTILKLKET